MRGGQEFNSNVLEISYRFPSIAIVQTELYTPTSPPPTSPPQPQPLIPSDDGSILNPPSKEYKITIIGNDLYDGNLDNTKVYVEYVNPDGNNILSEQIDIVYYNNIKSWTNNVIEIIVPDSFFSNKQTRLKVNYKNFYTNPVLTNIPSSVIGS